MHFFAIFLKKSFQTFRKFSQTFPTICVFRPTRKKINAQFVNLFEKYAKIMRF